MGMFIVGHTGTATKMGSVSPGNFSPLIRERAGVTPTLKLLLGINVTPLGTLFKSLLDLWKTDKGLHFC